MVALWHLFGPLHRPIPVRFNGSVFARKVHSTPEFAMTVLSKCAFVCQVQGPSYLWRRPTLLSGRVTRGPNYVAKTQVKSLTIFIGFMSFHRLCSFFPTCQVRVVRFYQSACPPPPPPPPPRLAVLLALLLASASSTSTSALPTLPTRRQALRQLPSSVRTAGRQPASCPAQCAPLDLNLRAAQLSVHRWTSQPGTCPAQCAPLDLNRGPSQLSVHHWTSTGDLPSSVCTAGPQQPDRMPEDMPDRMSDRMPEDMPDKMPWDMPDRMPEDMPDRMPEDLPEDMPDRMPEDMPDRMPDKMSDRMPQDMPDRIPEDLPDNMPEDMPDRMPEDMPDRMPEDLPVRKCINVMVGITRSKVIVC